MKKIITKNGMPFVIEDIDFLQNASQEDLLDMVKGIGFYTGQESVFNLILTGMSNNNGVIADGTFAYKDDDNSIRIYRWASDGVQYADPIVYYRKADNYPSTGQRRLKTGNVEYLYETDYVKIADGPSNVPFDAEWSISYFGLVNYTQKFHNHAVTEVVDNYLLTHREWQDIPYYTDPNESKPYFTDKDENGASMGQLQYRLEKNGLVTLQGAFYTGTQYTTYDNHRNIHTDNIDTKHPFGGQFQYPIAKLPPYIKPETQQNNKGQVLRFSAELSYIQDYDASNNSNRKMNAKGQMIIGIDQNGDTWLVGNYPEPQTYPNYWGGWVYIQYYTNIQ